MESMWTVGLPTPRNGSINPLSHRMRLSQTPQGLHKAFKISPYAL